MGNTQCILEPQAVLRRLWSKCVCGGRGYRNMAALLLPQEGLRGCCLVAGVVLFTRSQFLFVRGLVGVAGGRDDNWW